MGGAAPAGYVVSSVNEYIDVLMELAGNVDVEAEVAKMEKEKLKLIQVGLCVQSRTPISRRSIFLPKQSVCQLARDTVGWPCTTGQNTQ